MSDLIVTGGKLSCLEYGKGKPLIVLHGGPGLGCRYLLPQMSALGKFSSAIFYDQRGAGDSICTDDWQQHPFEAYINDIDEIRKSSGCEKISLLSHSFGNIFSSFYALAFPERVDKMICVNSVPLASDDYFEFVAHRKRIVDENKSALDAIRETVEFLRGDPAVVEKFYRLYLKIISSNLSWRIP